MDKLPLDSKKWTMGVLGVLGVLIASAAAVAFGGVSAGVVLPLCIKAIAGIAGAQIVAQGTQDSITAAKKPSGGTNVPCDPITAYPASASSTLPEVKKPD
jgi:hypothetical protein